MKRLDQYAWSIHRGFLSKAKKWNWLYKQFVLQMLTANKNRQILVYKQFMAQEQDQDLGRILDSKSLPSMLGSERFISWIKDRFFKKKKYKQVPAAKKLAPDLDTIISQVCRYYKVKPANLKTVRRGIENEPRDVAMYLIRSIRAEPLMRAGANFGLTQYSSVSSAVMRVKAKLQVDKKFKGCLQDIESNILKGQT